VIVPGVEGDDYFSVPALTEGDSMGIMRVLEQRDNHAGEGEAVSEGVGDTILPSAVDLGDDQNVVEQEHLSLVLTWSVFLVRIRHLVEPAVADQSSIGDSKVGTLGHDRLLDLHHLGHMVRTRPELAVANSFVHPIEHFTVHITSLVNSTKILDEVLRFHSLLWFQVRSVQVSIQKNDREGQDEDGVCRVEFAGHIWVASTISLTKYFHQSLYFLSFTRHPKICLKLSECHVNLHIGQVHLICKTLCDGLIEGVADIAQILSDHLLGKAFPCDEESGYSLSRIVEKTFPYKILNSTLWLFVEDIETRAIVALAYDFIDSVVGVIDLLGSAGIAGLG